MKLINLTTFQLEEYYNNVPEYAILLDQILSKHQSKEVERQSLAKILGARKQAVKEGYNYLWCDTCCIDKGSSAELSKNINSMFNYYADSAVCYAYLRDVPEKHDGRVLDDQIEHLKASQWFTRGWTLQELLAPKETLLTTISKVTGIAAKFIERRPRDSYAPQPLFEAGVATKMSWLSRRETTRVEDMAYCMLGIFDINMPLLYGEAHKAFVRLQEEIIRGSNDQSIFCWRWDEKSVPHSWASILSPSPKAFDQAAAYKAFRVIEDEEGAKIVRSQLTYSLTNLGLSITLPVVPWFGGFLAVLEVYDDDIQLAIPLGKPIGRTYTRMQFPPSPVPIGWCTGMFVSAR
ncbi:vegetative incompatibility protein HET-E-1 [Triangularia setosa]|uniref:Vegetative incompatibility protein HET-E-1 n=1 Tax=Triangularia setosa TaxID=2587417 RepID=A0AAN6W267_9PEZI|nr:vegetative incompatibility protein HET-E-1 [Podospora setosa]